MSDKYKRAGVDTASAEELVKGIKTLLEKTHHPGVVSGIGGFASIFDPAAIYPEYNGPLIAQSTDGVGTKLQIAQMLSPPRLWTCGVDVVNHCINDILCSGATPVTFLDYIAQDRLRQSDVVNILRGMAYACSKAGIALVGGETAQMQGTYKRGESDIVGFITGFVERDEIIDGSNIRRGACLIGLASNGLHTNGFSLVRKIFPKLAVKGHKRTWPYMYFKEIGEQLLSVLLRPHTSYLEHINLLRREGVAISGIAHITGGGISGNLVRILPEGLGARINKGSWNVLPVFRLIQEKGRVSEEEMFDVFNMGIGMIIAVPPWQGNLALMRLAQAGFEAYEIGKTEKGERAVIIE